MRNFKPAYLLGLGLILSIGWAFQSARKLYMAGQPISSDVRIVDGHAYVPVADVAKALNMTIREKPDGFDLVKGGDTTPSDPAPVKGGAPQVLTNSAGKLGGEIFTGLWRFQVLSMSRAKHFDVKLSKYIFNRSVEAKEGTEFVILNCRVKNGRTAKDELVFGPWDGNNTALTDIQEQTYEPRLYDLMETEGAPSGAAFLPGAAINFTLVFQVPSGTEVKDLIFTAMRYAFRGKDDQEKEKPTDIRVSLK